MGYQYPEKGSENNGSPPHGRCDGLDCEPSWLSVCSTACTLYATVISLFQRVVHGRYIEPRYCAFCFVLHGYSSCLWESAQCSMLANFIVSSVALTYDIPLQSLQLRLSARATGTDSHLTSPSSLYCRRRHEVHNTLSILKTVIDF